MEASCSSSGSMATNMDGCGSGVTGVQVQQNGEDGRVSVSSLLNEEVYLELESKAVSDTKALAVELCRHFYSLGWLSGTGGSFTLRVHHHHDAVSTPSHLIVMSPSGMETLLYLSLSLSLYASTCVYCPCACTLLLHVFMVVLLVYCFILDYKCILCRCSEGENGSRGYVCAIFGWVCIDDARS